MLISLLLLLTSVFADDSPIIIERPLNRVEFDDLLLEYNKDQAPRRNLSLTLDVFVQYTKEMNGELTSVLILDQSWEDTRLQFKGVSAIPLPAHVVPWMPDTYIVEAITDVVQQSDITLTPDGTLRLRQRRHVLSDCDRYNLWEKFKTDEHCTLTFGSFANRGAEILRYHLRNFVYPNSTKITGYTTNDYSETNFDKSEHHYAAANFNISRSSSGIAESLLSAIGKNLEKRRAETATTKKP